MKLVIVDLETTGLDPLYHQILEIGVVLFDTETAQEMDVRDMPSLTIRLKHDELRGQPVALAMNHRLLLKLAHEDELDEGEMLLEPQEVATKLADFILMNGFDTNQTSNKVTIICGGKNVATCDLRFLQELPYWEETFGVASRIYDPAPQFMKPDDKYPPNLAECAQRAGLVGTEVSHKALDDAMLVARILQQWFAWMSD
jgi:oligoribonuclease